MKKIIFILLFTAGLYPQDEMSNVIRNIAAESNGKVGVGIYHIGTGESAWLNADGRFPMQSVYKLPIGMAVLAEVDEGNLKLDDTVTVYKKEFISKAQHSPLRDMHTEGDFRITVEELIRYAVSESDGTASDVLMRLAGGAGKIMDYMRSIGVNDIRIADTEMEFGKDNLVQYRNWITPNGAVALLKALFEGKGLKPESRQLLFRFLTETETGLKRIKGRLPRGTEVAHKTGSSGTTDGIAAATNDIGIIRLPDGTHLIIAVFVSDSPEPISVREDVISKISRYAFDVFTGAEKCNCF